MEVSIRKATIEDAKGRGYVHYQAWIEAYTGLIEQRYLDTRTLDICVMVAEKHPENTFVAEVDGRIIGFASYSKCRCGNPDHGEVKAIYVLKDFYGKGVGRLLMDACNQELKEYPKVIVWVLDSNERALEFYNRIGFSSDGVTKEEKLGDITTIKEIRMMIDNPYYK